MYNTTTDDDDFLDDRGVLKPGRKFRMPVLLMDSAQRAVYEATQHRTAVDARDVYIDSISNAWKSPDSAPAPAAPAVTAATAYDAYCERISSAWRQPA